MSYASDFASAFDAHQAAQDARLTDLEARLTSAEDRLTALETAPDPTPQRRVGFAEYEGVTGGSTLVNVTTAAELIAAVQVSGNIVDAGNRAFPLTSMLEITADDVTLQNVEVTGKGIRVEGATNVIIQNVYSHHMTGVDTDCLTIRNATSEQVVAVYDSVFTHAMDGGIDIIWNHNNQVRVTIANCQIKHTDKACLIHSGNDVDEGGRYYISIFDTTFYDCYQRMPMIRDGYLHMADCHIERYGDPVGAGNGVQVSRNEAKALIENLTVVPRVTGETTFSGATVTNPRVMAAKAVDVTASVRFVNPPSDPATWLEQNPTAVLDPVYY